MSAGRFYLSADDEISLVVRVPLRPNGVATIDIADWPMVRRFNWRRLGQYAATQTRSGSERHWHTMHRDIMGQPVGLVDHKDRDPLNNRRGNLRVVTHKQSQLNRSSARKVNPYKGVSQTSANGRWRARLWNGNSYTSLGLFDDPISAARAYDAAAERANGEYAVLNFPKAVR